MKAFLMFADRDFDTEAELPAHRDLLIADLELNTVFKAMADGDQLLYEVAARALLSSLQNPEEILYRQQVLQDCVRRAAIIRELYELAGDAIASEKTVWRSFAREFAERKPAPFGEAAATAGRVPAQAAVDRRRACSWVRVAGPAAFLSDADRGALRRLPRLAGQSTQGAGVPWRASV